MLCFAQTRRWIRDIPYLTVWCYVQNTMYKIQCTKYNVQNTMYKILCTKYNVQNTMYKIQCTKYNVQSIMYKVQRTLQIIQDYADKGRIRW